MIGGNVSINFNSSKGEIQDNKSFGCTISPSYSYFLNDRLAIGAAPFLAYAHSDWNGDQSRTFGNAYWLGLTPMVRYYLWSFVFTDIRFGGVGTRNNFTIVNNGSTEEIGPEWSHIYFLEFGFEPNYFINDNIVLESRLFHRSEFRPNQENVQSHRPWLQFSIGFQVFID